MSAPPRAARTVHWVALAVVTVVIVLAFAWPRSQAGSPAGTQCGAIEEKPGRTYCYESVVLTAPPLQCPYTANGSFNWTAPSMSVEFSGFAFHLLLWICTLEGGTAVSVTEPNSTTYEGGTFFGGPFGHTRTSWFSPDNESGIYQQAFNNDTVTLYVVDTG